MNKSRGALSNFNRKKINKEIRLAPALPTKPLPEENKFSKSPTQQNPFQEYAQLRNIKTPMKTKKKKHVKKISKRTTPGLVKQQTTPRHPHIEGDRWIKTLEKQTIAKTQIVRNKTAKR